jgi:hypothetical protein
MRKTLLPVTQSPEIARAFVRKRLVALGYPELVDNGCLITSELVTNVIKHVPTAREFYLRLRKGPLVEVWDPSVEVPRLIETPDGESGRGLHIIGSLSVRWSYDLLPPDRGGGKIVWALLR